MRLIKQKKDATENTTTTKKAYHTLGHPTLRLGWCGIAILCYLLAIV